MTVIEESPILHGMGFHGLDRDWHWCRVLIALQLAREIRMEVGRLSSA